MPYSRSPHRKIWDIAWPAILSNLSIPLLGLVDGAILGNLGDALGAKKQQGYEQDDQNFPGSHAEHMDAPPKGDA